MQIFIGLWFYVHKEQKICQGEFKNKNKLCSNLPVVSTQAIILTFYSVSWPFYCPFPELPEKKKPLKFSHGFWTPIHMCRNVFVWLPADTVRVNYQVMREFCQWGNLCSLFLTHTSCHIALTLSVAWPMAFTICLHFFTSKDFVCTLIA